MVRKFKETSGKHQGTHRITFLVEIQENSAKFKKIRIELVFTVFYCSDFFLTNKCNGAIFFKNRRLQKWGRNE